MEYGNGKSGTNGAFGHWTRCAVVAVLTAGLAACGGGGGGGGTPLSGNGSGTSTGGSTGGTTGGSTTTTTTSPAITVGLATSAGIATTSVTSAGTTATARLLDAAGAVVANRLVTFSSDASLVTLTPASGQALTDASGVATVQVAPASLTVSGAGTLVATALVGSTSITSSVDFRLSAANVQLQSLSVGSGALAAFGNRAVSVRVLADGVAVTNSAQVTFAASCGTVSPASVATDSTGTAATTYTASVAACAGTNVTVTASSSGAASVSAPLVVSPAIATNIQYVSSTPAILYLAGSTGATQSAVVFKVVDSTGTAQQNQTVSLSLVNAAPGISLGTVGNSNPVAVSTDAAGLVSVAVFSGSVPTSVQVRATLATNSAVTTTSNTLVVAVGRPAQSRTSISVGSFSIEGLNRDGTTTPVTVSVSDRQGNPVPDGTQVNLTTESGVLINPTCVTTGGSSQCSVQLRSQGSRPADGRVSILAYLPGDEDFVDLDGNNVFSAGDTFTDLGNAYRDDNDNGVYDAGEFVVPRSGSLACSAGTFGRAGTCDGVWGTVDVRAQTTVLFAASSVSIVGSFTDNGRSLTAVLADANNSANSAPTGSGIAVSFTSTSSSSTCAPSTTQTSIPNTYGPTAARIVLSNCTSADTINVAVTVPASGLVTTRSFALAPAVSLTGATATQLSFTVSSLGLALPFNATLNSELVSGTCTVGRPVITGSSATATSGTVTLAGCTSGAQIRISASVTDVPYAGSTQYTVP